MLPALEWRLLWTCVEWADAKETQKQAQLKIPLWLSKVKALPIFWGEWEGDCGSSRRSFSLRQRATVSNTLIHSFTRLGGADALRGSSFLHFSVCWHFYGRHLGWSACHGNIRLKLRLVCFLRIYLNSPPVKRANRKYLECVEKSLKGDYKNYLSITFSQTNQTCLMWEAARAIQQQKLLSKSV